MLDRPIIVVGAGRSGTTMIRETLVQHSEVAGFEYEMNHLWRFGNESLSHDLLCPEEHLTPQISEHIVAAFESLGARQGCGRVLDKTVANVMRTKYIQTVLPEAKFLHTIRDGRAVAASAMKRWSAKQPPGYFLSKLATVPFRSVPRVTWTVLSNKVKGLKSDRNYRQSWGSRWPGLDKAVEELPLVQVCARQWAIQVRAALAQKNELKSGTYMEVRYEDLVQNPLDKFSQICSFFELSMSEELESWINSKIDAGRIEKWQSELSEDELALVMKEQSILLEELGYT